MRRTQCERVLKQFLFIGLILLSSAFSIGSKVHRVAADKPLHIGDTVSGALSELESPDRYVLFGAYDDLLSVGVFPDNSGDHSPSLEIDAPDGSIVASAIGSTDALVSALRLPSTGAYILYVKADQPNALVHYSLTVGAGWILRDLDGGTLSAGKSVQGKLPRHADRQVWRLTAAAQSTFTVLAQPQGDSTLDPVIEVVMPNGDQLTVAHDFSSSHSALTSVISLPNAGIYTIKISAYINQTVGAYDLIVRLLPATSTPPPTLTPFVTSQPIEQRIDGHVAQGTQYGSTFGGVPGQRVTITVHGKNGFDPLLEIYGPSGRRAAIADDVSAVSTDAALTLTLDDGIGMYTIRVTGYALSAGDFTLTVHSSG